MTLDAARRERLSIWAQRRNPDNPRFGVHDYHGECPWCRSEAYKRDWVDGEAHATALELLQRLDTVEAWLASAEATMLAALDDKPGWRNDAAVLVAGLYGETYKPA